MPITLSQLAAYRKSVTVNYADEQVQVWYKPGAVTPELTDKLSTDDPDESNVARLMDFMTLALDAWDVLDADGKQMPPSLELIRQMPIEFLNVVFTEIMQSMQAGEARAGTSGATSSLAGR